MVEPILQRCAQEVNGEVDDAYHHEDENRDGGPFAGQNLIDAPTALVFFAFLRLHHGLVAQPLDEGEAHLSHGRGAVEPAFFFHLHDEMLQSLFFVLGELQGIHDDIVAFHKLRGSEAHWDVNTLGMVFNEVHDAVQAPVYGPTVIVLVAEILTDRGFLVFRHMDGVVYQFGNTFVFGGRNGHHGQTEDFLHFIHEDTASIVAHFVHHVERQNHRDAQFHELHGEV